MTYQEAQLLETDLTHQSIREPRRDYIQDELEQENAPNTTTTLNPPNISATLTNTLDRKVGGDLTNLNKRSTIYNPAAYLTTPHKPKIQYVDHVKIKNFCMIGMEFLENEKYCNSTDETLKYKANALEQQETKSLSSLPGTPEFIEMVV